MPHAALDKFSGVDGLLETFLTWHPLGLHLWLPLPHTLPIKQCSVS